MIKETIVNPTLTPSGRLAFAGSMLTGPQPEAQTRWSPGSLATSVIGAASMPLIVAVSLTQLVAVSGAAGDLLAAFNAVKNPDSLVFQPEPGETKTRNVTIANYTYGMDVQDEATNYVDSNSVAGKILAPVRPSYTALSLLNTLETIAPSGDFYVILLDQVSGKVMYSTFESQAAADSAITSMAGMENISVEAAYLMTPPSVGGSSNAGKFGWE